jgi:hypothetical protein
MVLLSVVWWNVNQRECVSICQKLYCIEDLEKSGTERTFCIANHAPVSMVCGLHRKWKQSVSYYLNHGNTKANLLVKFLNAGLHVVATVCDGCEQCQGLETVVCYQMEAIFQVPESRYCEWMILHTWSATEPCSSNTICSFSLSLYATSWWEHILNDYKWDKQNIISLFYKLTRSGAVGWGTAL